MRQFTTLVKIHNESEEDGVGISLNTKDYQNVYAQIKTTGFSGTVKAQSSFGIASATYETAPDFSASISASNPWEFTGMVSMEDASNTVDGDTGIAFSSSTDVQIYKFNSDFLGFVNFQISNYSAGSVTIEVICSNN